MSKTVFVVGAGASKEAGLPLGTELKEQIANVLRYRIEHGRLAQIDPVLSSVYDELARRDKPFDINPYLNAARRISTAMPQAISIDNFIDAWSGDHRIEICGKLAIAKCILDAERNSTLYINRERATRFGFEQLQETWYNRVMQLITENCRLEGLADRLSSVAFVVFNYDRCIEHFLYHALQNYYPISAEQAAELVSRVEIFHPYGTVGHLPWQKGSHSIEFGSRLEDARLAIKVASELKTFTEGTDEDSSQILSIRETLHEANRIVFLGFAYHRQNLKLLFPSAPVSLRSVQIFGTSLGLSKSDMEGIEYELKSMTNAVAPAALNSTTAAGLFGEFWRRLSFVHV